MDFEEVVYRLKQDKNLEFEFIGNDGEWKPLQWAAPYLIEYLLTKQFRLKKEKNKRYQIIYKDIEGCFWLTPSTEKYTKEEFEEKFKHDAHKRTFYAIIPASLKESDE